MLENSRKTVKDIPHKTAIQILEQRGTNSVPFLVLCDDSELYVAKTMFKTQPPFEDLINEILSVYFLDSMQVSTIPASLITIPQDVFESFKMTGKKFDTRYNTLLFDKRLFFASLFQPTTTEVELYNTTLKNKYDYNKYLNPIDFIKIGIFDLWIGNMDRRGSNPNILVSETPDGKFEFLPIDHTQCFANQSDYKAMRLAIMDSTRSKSILRTPMSKSIISFTEPRFIADFHKDVSENFDNVIHNMEFAFGQVPGSLGFSQKGKERIKEILSDEERNLRISKAYLNYIK